MANWQIDVKGVILLTKLGYDSLIQKINQRLIDPPHDLCRNELERWIEGYSQAVDDILRIIEKERDESQMNL